MSKVETVLVKPLLTEKSQHATEKQNRYVFHVALAANKFQIKNAVEKMFDGAKVAKVNTMNVSGKKKRTRTYKYGKTVKRKKATKKVAAKKGKKRGRPAKKK